MRVFVICGHRKRVVQDMLVHFTSDTDGIVIQDSTVNNYLPSNSRFWRMSFWILHHVALVRWADVSGDHITSIFRVTKLLNLPISQQGYASRRTAGAFARGSLRHEAYPRSELGRFNSLVTLKMEAVCSSEISARLTRATRCNISKAIRYCYRCEN
jgi:hypothetical protein